MIHTITLSQIKKCLKPIREENYKKYEISNINKLYEQKISQPFHKDAPPPNATSQCSHSIKDFYTTLIQGPGGSGRGSGKNNHTNSSTKIKHKHSVVEYTSYHKAPCNSNISFESILPLLSISSEQAIPLKKYYIYGSEPNDSYFDSLLLSTDETYRNYKYIMPTHSKPLTQKKKELSSEIDLFIHNDCWLKKVYKEHHIKPKEIPKKLFHNKDIDSDIDLKLALADYYRVSVFVINMERKDYRYMNHYNSNTNKTVVLLEYNSKYEPIINADSVFIQYIHKNSSMTIRAHLKVTLYPMKNYHVSDLKEMVTSLGMSIIDETNGKKKLKRQLYEDIISYIKDL